MGLPSEDHLLEITKLRSLVEHLSERLERFEEGKSFGSASSGAIRSIDLEGPARVSDDRTRPPNIPSLPLFNSRLDSRQFSFEDPSLTFLSPPNSIPKVPGFGPPPTPFHWGQGHSQGQSYRVGTGDGMHDPASNLQASIPGPPPPPIMSPRARQTPVQGVINVQGVEHVWQLVDGQLQLNRDRSPMPRPPSTTPPPSPPGAEALQRGSHETPAFSPNFPPPPVQGSASHWAGVLPNQPSVGSTPAPSPVVSFAWPEWLGGT